MSYGTENQATAEDLTPQNEAKHEIIEFIKMVAWFLVLFLLVKTYVVEGYEVLGPSMEPTLHDRERILVFKLGHNLSKLPFLRGWEAIGPGDVVVFDSPVEPDKRYVKRVIARGPIAHGGNIAQAEDHGQDSANRPSVKVQYDRGTVYVNRKRIDESYLEPGFGECSEYLEEQSVPPGGYYVMGDNRRVSKDSRSFGAVDDGRIVGRAVLRFWPLNKISLLR